MCIAKVNDQLVIESLDIYYNPDDLLKPLTTQVEKCEGGRASGSPNDGDSRGVKTGDRRSSGGAQSSCAVMLSTLARLFVPSARRAGASKPADHLAYPDDAMLGS